MSFKLKKQIEHLKFLTRILRSWDFYTQDNNGVYKDKVRLMTYNGELILTKTQLMNHINYTKLNINRTIHGLK